MIWIWCNNIEWLPRKFLTRPQIHLKAAGLWTEVFKKCFQIPAALYISAIRICNKKFGQRPKGQIHGLFVAFLAFKSQILENYVVNSILPSLQFWFCLSKWLHLENNFWVPNYATGLRSACSSSLDFLIRNRKINKERNKHASKYGL